MDRVVAVGPTAGQAVDEVAPGAPPSSDPGLAGKVGSGLRWGFATQLVVRLCSLASGIVVARLLVPEDYGVFATAMLVVTVLFGLNDLGLQVAVIRWTGDPVAAARTAMTMATAASTGLYIACFLAAPAFAEFMNSLGSAPILRVMALTVVLDGLVTGSQALLVRGFHQRLMAKAELVSLPVGIVATIAGALAGLGPWSLALGYILGTAVTAVILYLSAPVRLRPGWDASVARPLLVFGVPLGLTSIVEYALLNTDYLVAGRLLGPAALGLYVLAYNVSSWPATVITETVRRVSIAGFATMGEDRAALAAAFRRTFRLLVTLVLPVALGMSLLASPLVVTLYGAAWTESGEVLSFLAVLGGVRVVVGFVFDLLVADGRSRLTLALKLAWLTVLVPGLWVAAKEWGIHGVALAHAVVALAVVTPMFVLAARAVGVDLRGLGRDLRRPLLATALAAAAVLAVRAVVAHPAAELLMGGGVLLAVYGAAVLPLRSTASALRSWRIARATR